MKELIVRALKTALDEKGIKLKDEEIEKVLEIPPNFEMGDYAFPCFFLAETLKQEPSQIALDIRNNLGNPLSGLQEIQTAGPYINFFIDRKLFSQNIVNDILLKGDNFGKKIIALKGMIEFSQPNTHKAFHVGHIRGTSIGESLARIAEFFDEKVIRANYSGDTGMHIAKWIWCYRKFHSKKQIIEDESWISSIYVDAVKRLGRNKKGNFQQEVEEINRKLESGEDPILNELWGKTRVFSINSWNKIYNQLNTKFDIHFFESDLEKRGKEISLKLLKKKIAKESEGALIVDLENYGLGIWVLLRKDGTVLYSAKELALTERKFKDSNLDWSVTVIGAAQSLHSQQLCKTLELVRFKNLKKIHFVLFGEVRLPTGKMSSRTGENILYSDFISDITDYSKKRITKKSGKISKEELEKRALIVSISAIKYSFLKQSSRKIIVFDKKEALNFEGDTGPYLLYTFARASSIIRKARIKTQNPPSEVGLIEFELVKKMNQFPDIILRAYRDLNPSLIANYSYQISKLFNEFYHACPVIGSENEFFRIQIVNSFRQILKKSLYLLGIETLEEM